MHRLYTVSSINTRTIVNHSKEAHNLKLKFNCHLLVISIIALGFMIMCPSAVFGQNADEVMEMSVVVVNPSSTKTQTVPIKMYLPKEVTPDAILDSAGLDVEYDSERSMYYVYKDAVILKPSETKTFDVEIKDVWKIPQGRLDSLANQTRSIVQRLEGSEFFETAKSLEEAIIRSLDTVSTTQNDPAVSRRTHIGIFRNNSQIVGQVKEDVEQLEKQLEIARTSPKPDVLERSKLKTDSPDKNTSWMIIFIIMLFIGMLAGVFFFTWQTQAHATKNIISEARDSSFPEREKPEDKKK